MHIINPSDEYIDMAIGYVLLFYVGFSLYLEYAVSQYGRWLRDNYADLENKELWVSHVMIIILFILVLADGFDTGDQTISCFLQGTEIFTFLFLLWRVETLPLLEENDQPEPKPQSVNLPSNIEQLLDEHCVSTQLYLRHDLTLGQLSQAVGINRFYLSQFFSRQGTTYNNYINDLRINHFVDLYRRATEEKLPMTAQQLANDSGYRSYSTFSLAFKQRMGQSVSVWMRDNAK
jgi:AraC-like DNA-binding protein